MERMQRPLCFVLLHGVIILSVLAAVTPPCNETSIIGNYTGGKDKLLELYSQGGVQSRREDALPPTDSFESRPRRSSDSDPLDQGRDARGSDKDPTDRGAKKPSGSSMLNANIHMMIILFTLCLVTALQPCMID